jgi:transcriptional regulator with XRE-family HTH domain
MRTEQSFGQRIRELRVSIGMTQRELAEVVAKRVEKSEGGRGFDFTYLSKIENDKMKPSALVINQLAEVLKTDLDELMILAGRLPEDFESTLSSSSGARAFFRSVRDKSLTEEQWKNLLDTLEDKK